MKVQLSQAKSSGKKLPDRYRKRNFLPGYLRKKYVTKKIKMREEDYDQIINKLVNGFWDPELSESEKRKLRNHSSHMKVDEDL